ncbi:WD_REPEATS_REGION domain-containing protein [Linnemannia gamsii]|uniref:WD_REPEATS_REGION domain-containing protein n=1 Tax=Linnemannia gamsii TaxID=64522 RepID=A0ABQ7KAD9_9FUNG|nr:WD_REPEATS_REGION domain-containing protein [Linnemannia gamsii]
MDNDFPTPPHATKYGNDLNNNQNIDLIDSFQDLEINLKTEVDMQEKLHLEDELQNLRTQRLKEFDQRIYIAPMAKANLQARDDALFPLMDRVQEFLASEREEAASRHSINRHLEHHLWTDYKQGRHIPLYVNLPTINDPAHDLIEKELQYHNFSEEQVREMKLCRQFILICDGYDESQLKINIHTANQFNRPGQWRVKVVISCRTQYLGQDYRSRFQPQPVDLYQRTKVDDFQEAVVAVFSRAQIEQYVDEYVKNPPAVDTFLDKPTWSVEEYMDKLVNIPSLLDLVSNPFLLILALEALPSVVSSTKDLSTITISRVQLYDSFVKQWLKVNRRRLEDSPLSDDERLELHLLVEDNFLYHSIKFQKDLATAIFIDHAGNPVVKYTHFREKNTWKVAFFCPEGQVKLLRESSTVMRSGASFRFIHRSFLEYFYSRTIYDPLDYDLEADGDFDESEPSPDLITCLTRINIVKEPSIIQFLAERVEADATFMRQLLGAINDSKTDANVAQASANAISVLVKVGVQFSGKELRGIKIPGADLRGGNFDSADFEGADLSDVNMSRAWLRLANFSNARMTGVQFGELPCLNAFLPATNCAFSFDGKLLVVAVMGDAVNVYDTDTWDPIIAYPGGPALAFSPVNNEVAIGGALKGHTKPVKGVAFSPTGDQLVSGGEDATARTWDMQTGEALGILGDHTDLVNSVAYSPDGSQIASSNGNNDVRLWDARTGNIKHILTGHYGNVSSVTFSPDGHQIASCSKMKGIHLWNSLSGELISMLTGNVHNTCAKFSPTNDYIASTALDGTVRLWRAGAEFEDFFLRLGDNFSCGDVCADGSRIVTCTEEGRMRIWETLTGKSQDIRIGFNIRITEMALSPCSTRVASSHIDHKLRLWDTQTGVLLHVLEGHTNTVAFITFSPSGDQVASGSFDRTVRVWNTLTGRLEAILEAHSGEVHGLKYSPSGHQIVASTSGNAAHVWCSRTGAKVFDLAEPAGRSWMFSPDGRYIISASEKGLRSWSSLTGLRMERLSDIQDFCMVFSMSPDNNFIAASSPYGMLMLWDVSSDCCCTEIYRVRTEMAYEVRWMRDVADADQLYLLTLTSGPSLRVWRLSKQEEEEGKESQGVYSLQLVRSIGGRVLSLAQTKADGVVGLSPANLRLLNQRRNE